MNLVCRLVSVAGVDFVDLSSPRPGYFADDIDCRAISAQRAFVRNQTLFDLVAEGTNVLSIGPLLG
jgi:hypothetical protein